MHCFQYPTLCFQYPMYVSNIQIMFPNAFLCFQYPICVSNIRCMFPNENDVSKLQCFQSMFPIYIEPPHLVFQQLWFPLPHLYDAYEFAFLRILLKTDEPGTSITGSHDFAM